MHLSSNHNIALWLKTRRGPFEIGPAPQTEPGPDEIVIRNRAIAVNPFDRLLQSVGDLVAPWLRYPAVVGTDVAGEVIAIGSAITRFKLGDRVLALAVGTEKKRNRPAEGAFQLSVIALERVASRIPDGMSYATAASLPLAISTAACGLFQPHLLGLDLPDTNVAHPKNQTLIVWGGSTSVGCNAIQLARASGYDVVTTCSLKNFPLVRQLGAREAFDYKSSTVVADIRSALKGRHVAGAIAITPGSGKKCVQILAGQKGSRFIAMASPPASFDHVSRGPGRFKRLAPTLVRIVAGMIRIRITGTLFGVQSKMIWGSALVENDLGTTIFADFLPQALAEGRYTPAPAVKVVGHGLEAITIALDKQRVGVSAQKLVVTL